MAVCQRSLEPAPVIPISTHNVPDTYQRHDFTHDHNIEPVHVSQYHYNNLLPCFIINQIFLHLHVRNT